jgi:oligopeptide transport system permease protein
MTPANLPAGTPASLPAETLAPARPWWTALVANRAALASGLFLALLVAVSLAGPGLYVAGLPADRQSLRDGVFQDYDAVNGPPSAVHWLGADYLGRDTLTRLMLAARVSLIVALVVEGLNVGLGGSLGLLAGYLGGWADAVIARLADVLFAFPGLLLAILVSAVFGETARTLYGGVGRLLLVAGALSLVSWPLMARYVRSEVLSIKGRDYILAARSLGASGRQIIVRHLLPNTAWLIIVAATLDVAGVVVNEATLSLLGLGIEEPGASLGLMIFRASSQIERFPAQTLWPAVLITALVLAFSFLGDGLRDVFDPNSAR